MGHTPSEVNYQDAVPCSVCGEPVGPLTPDFVTYGIVADMKVGQVYDYETNCYEDTPHRIKGIVDVMSYTVVASDATHEAKDGYEWRIAILEISFPDENSQKYGYRYGYNMTDYYNIRLLEDSWVNVGDYDSNVPHNRSSSFLVSYHGREMECYSTIKLVGMGPRYQHIQVSIQVPVGYDGIVFGYRDAAIEWPSGKAYIFDLYEPGSYLLFRFA